MKNFNLVLKKAKKNNLESQKTLGFFYYKKQDYKNALFWWKKALLLGDTAQNFNIGNCYHEGWGVKRNFKKALKYFLNCTKNKKNRFYADACFNLGSMYSDGEGTKKNIPKAIKFYNEGAKLNHTMSISMLGLMLDPKAGIIDKKYKNAEESFKFHLTNAKKGFALSQIHLAEHYYEGNGVKRNLQQAKKYFNLALTNKNKKQHGLSREQFNMLKNNMPKLYRKNKG